MKAKYYIVDYGKDMLECAEALVNKLKEDKHHVVVYLTDMEYLCSAMEISEDEFLSHYSIITNN